MTASRTGLPVPTRSNEIHNAGLALDCYIPDVVGGQRNPVYYRAIADAGVSSMYQLAFTRWKRALTARSYVRTHELAIDWRVIVGLGGASVHETGITLLHPYGVPYLPGSAIKGLASHYAVETLREADPRAFTDDHVATLFGEEKRAGYITYFDAWFVPGTGEERKPLRRDTITVHHPEYYRSGGVGAATTPRWKTEPNDFTDPTPISFLSARGTYLVAVEGPNPEWSERALELVRDAVAARGIGAKTSSGYGFTAPRRAQAPQAPQALPPPGFEVPPLDRAALDPTVVALVQQVDALPATQVRGQAFAIFNQRGIAAQGRAQLAAAIYERLRDTDNLDWAMARGQAEQWLAPLRTFAGVG